MGGGVGSGLVCTGERIEHIVIDLHSRGKVLYVSAGSKLFKSIDAGSTWIEIGPDVGFTWIGRVAINPKNPKHIYLPTTLGVFRSENGGKSWEKMEIDLNRRVRVITFNPSGTLMYWGTTSGIYKISTQTPVKENRKSLPKTSSLQQNYPNPFNSKTRIDYTISKRTQVLLRIFNLQGQVVRNLVNSYQPPGHYTTYWDGRDDDGEKVSNGVYFYIFKTTTFMEVKK